ncbi:MAG: DNA polymerase III subunit delta' [Micrococcaceae bacterium]
MSVWDELIGQEKTVEQLKKALEKPNHAWLFTGPPGSGRSNTARAFAAALECEHHTGCGKCKACLTVLSGVNADVTVLATDKVTITIDEVRALIAKSYDRPSVAPWRIIIVEDADRMTERTSNVLLKALEEPASRTIWMLCAPSPADLLPTLRSRCQSVTLKIPHTDDIARLLHERDGIDLDIARDMARISQGHIGVARWLATSKDARERRKRILSVTHKLSTVGQAVRAANFLVNTAKEQAEASAEEFREQDQEQLMHALGVNPDETLPPYVRAHLKQLDEDYKRRSTRGQKDALDRMMLDMLSFYRDVLLQQMSAKIEPMNVDMLAAIEKIASTSTAEQTTQRIEKIKQARQRLTTNAAPLLTLEAMVLGLL